MSRPVLVVVLLLLVSAIPLQPRALQFPQELTNGVQPNFISLSPSMSPSESPRLLPPSAPESFPPVPASSTSPSESQRPPSQSTPASSPTAPALSMSPPESQRPLAPSTPKPSHTVPALFVIGDSTVDSGTNNFLGTLARADRSPYGRDFDTHRPTGRFCNGRIPVDYLALHLGLPFIPSYLGHTGDVADMMHGVNYASSGAGIIFSSGSELGQHISFTQQIQQVFDTAQQLTLSIGQEATTELISNSVFYISIGTNDYIHYYLRNVSSVQSLYLPWSFNQFLTHTMKQEIKNLYNANVRKVVIMGLPPVGCAPYYLWRYRSENGECIQMVNNMILELNFALRYMAEELSQELANFDIIFCDVFAASMDIIKNSDRYGFNVTADACCGLGKHKGMIMCFSQQMACSNASNYIWWDQFHPTDRVNAILADNVWSSLHTEICYPTNLQDMLSRKAK